MGPPLKVQMEHLDQRRVHWKTKSKNLPDGSVIGQSSFHSTSIFLQSLVVLSSAFRQPRASVGQASLDLEDEVSVPLSGSNKGHVKAQPSSSAG